MRMPELSVSYWMTVCVLSAWTRLCNNVVYYEKATREGAAYEDGSWGRLDGNRRAAPEESAV